MKVLANGRAASLETTSRGLFSDRSCIYLFINLVQKPTVSSVKEVSYSFLSRTSFC